MSAVMSRFEVKPLRAPLGAEIIGFPWSNFSAEDVAAVRRAWLDHVVLRFPATDITDETHVRFTRMFGPAVTHPRQLQQGAHAVSSDILVVSNMKNADGTPAGDLGDDEVNWHTDTWFKERPPAGSFLRSLRIPPTGGNTQFASMYRAYETLPVALKSSIQGRFIHHQTVIDGRGEVRMGMTKPASDDPREWPGVDHPIARTHGETGRKALYLGGSRRFQCIVGMPLDEARDLLDQLWAYAVRPEFVWTQKWTLGDAVMWDNRCAMHRRDAFDKSSERLMHRTVFEGERPH